MNGPQLGLKIDPMFECFSKSKPVGYLSPEQDYPRGEVSEDAVDRLVDLAKHPLVAWCGSHDCELDPCGSGQFQPELKYRGLVVPTWCSTDIFVPGESALYVVPALILHYILCHKYAPPSYFLDAVIACPKAASKEYFAALKRFAPTASTGGADTQFFEKIRDTEGNVIPVCKEP